MAPKPDRIVIYRPAATKREPNPGWRIQLEGPRSGNGEVKTPAAHMAYGKGGGTVTRHKAARAVLGVEEYSPLLMVDAVRHVEENFPGVQVYIPQGVYDPKADEGVAE